MTIMCAKKCGREAEYDSPDHLCEDHWIEWWVEGMEPRTPEERAMLMAEMREVLAQQDPVRAQLARESATTQQLYREALRERMS